MREFKFRAWHKSSRSMRYPLYLCTFHEHPDPEPELTKPEPISMVAFREGGLHFKKDDYILMQYTGLKDAKGVEVWEGDILRDDDPMEGIVYTVEWIDKEAHFAAIDRTKTLRLYGIYWKQACEVIGNIYENPELINE